LLLMVATDPDALRRDVSLSLSLTHL
jgi:hypothetical protein